MTDWIPFAILVWLDTTPGTFSGERIWILDPEDVSQAPANIVLAIWLVGLLAAAAIVLNRRSA